jgi:ankyrin repeat protein
MGWEGPAVAVLLSLVSMAAPGTSRPRDFRQAVSAGDVEAVRRGLRDTPSLANSRDPYGRPPLCLAAEEGRADVVELLLKAGADPNAAAPDGGNALLHSLRGGHKEVAQLLIEAGSDCAVRDRDGATAVLAACAYAYYDMARTLLQHGAEADVFVGSALGAIADVQKLVEADPGSMHTGDPLLHMTALEWAARTGHTDLARMLLARGALLNDQDTSPGPLFWACWSGDGELVHLLLAEGAAAVPEKVQLALEAACIMGHPGIADLLLTKGADANGGESGWMWGTPLHLASGFGREETVRVLLARGAEVDAKSVRVESVLNSVERPGWVEHVSLMACVQAKESGAKADRFLMPGEWLEQETPKSVLWDLRKDVLLPPLPSTGYTPLHWAAHMGHEAVCRALIAAGAQAGAVGLLRDAPIHWASRGGHSRVVRLLLEKGADARAVSVQVGGPLHWAARTGQTHVAVLLLGEGVGASTPDGNGRTPLHLAALYGQPAFAEMLLAHGAKLDEKDKEGLSALATAVRGGHEDIADLLRQHGAKE